MQITGHFCECKGLDCPKDTEQRLCGGQGECHCGICRCEEGFTGDDCTCTLDEKNCMDGGVGPISKKIFIQIFFIFKAR